MKSLEDQVFVFHNSKALRGSSQSVRVRVAGLQGGESEDKPLVQLFVVEDCSGFCGRTRHPLQVASSKLGCCCVV